MAEDQDILTDDEVGTGTGDPGDSTLSPENRKKLDNIVMQMAAKNAPKEDVQAVVADFKKKYGGATMGPAIQPGDLKGKFSSKDQNAPYSPNYDKLGQGISITPEKREEMLAKGKAAIEKFGQDYDQAQQNIKIAMEGNNDIIPKVIQHQRQQLNFQNAKIPGTDQPLTESAKAGLALLSAPQEQPVTDEDVSGYLKSVNESPAAARAHITNIMKYKNDQAKDLGTSMYINDAAQRYMNGGDMSQIEENIQGLKDGKLTYNINTGRVIKPENAIQSIFTGVKNKMQAFDDYHFIENATPQERIKWMQDKQKNMNPDEPIPMPEGVLAQATYGIASQPFLGLAGGKLAGAGVAAIPGLEELAPATDKAVSAWLTGTDFGKMAESHAYQEVYSQLQAENQQKPANERVSDEEIDQKAMEQAKQEGITEGIAGSAMMLFGGKIGEIKLPKISLSEGFRAAAATTLRNIAKTGAEASTIGLISAGAKDLENKLAEQKGIFRSENGDDIREAALQGGLLTAGIIGFTKGTGLISGITKQKLLQGFSQVPEDKFNEAVGEQVLNKTITPEDAKNLTKAVEDHRNLDQSIPDDITEDSRLKIQRRIEKRQSLENELETKDKAYHPEIKEQIKGINDEILELSKDKKPKEESISQDVPRSTIPEEGQNKAENKGDITDEASANTIKPNSDIIQPTDAFRTLDYGENKGQEENKAAQEKIKQEVLNDEPIGKTGEKFSIFLQRVLPAFKDVMDKERNNTTIVTHSSVIKALRVWEEMGRPDISEITGDKLKDFAQKYVDLNPETEGKVNSFKGDNGNEIKVVRHGETEDNKLSEFRQDDTQLTDKGIAQAKKAGKNLLQETGADVPKIISSDLPRAIHTSNLITEQLKPTENASSIRGDQGQIQETGDGREGSQNAGGENIQSPAEPSPINGETQQQAGQEKVDEKYGLPFYDEPADKKTGLKNAISNRGRFERSLPKVELPKIGSDYERVLKGKELVESGKINPREVVDDVLKTGRALQPDESKAMMYYMHQLATHAQNLTEAIAGTENEFEKADLSSQLQQLSDEVDAATEANMKTGTASSEVFHDRQVVLDVGFNPSRERAIIKDAYGGEIPKDVKDKLEKAFKERDNAIAEQKKLEEKLRKVDAQKKVSEMKKEKEPKGKTDYKEKRKGLMDDLQKAKDEHEQWLKDQGIQKSSLGGFTLTNKMVGIIGKIAKTYVDEGIEKIEDLIAKVHDDVKDFLTGIDKKDVRDAIALYESERLSKKATNLEEKIKAGDIENPKSKLKLNFENNNDWVRANQRVINAEFKIKQEKRKAFESQKNMFQKTLQHISFGVKLSLLSGYNVLGKLAAAATIGGAIKRVPEQLAGKMWGGIFKGIAEKAPIEGSPTLAAEMKFYKEFLNPSKFLHNAKEILKTGSSDLGKKFQGGEYKHIPVISLPTDLHQIIKDPLKRATYEASLKNALNWAQRQGLNINEPLVKQSLETAAYKRANYEIFQEDSRLTRWLKTQKAKLDTEGNTGAIKKFLIDFAIPISTVPTNIGKRLISTSPAGLIRGGIKVADAYKKGIDNLQPEEADAIMRQLKQGSVGTALWLIGWFGYQNYGGLYSQFNPNKERHGDLTSDQMMVNGEMIPKPVQHALPLEIIQLAATMRRIYDRDVNKGDGDFVSLLKAGAGSIGAVAEQIPILETGSHVYEAFKSDYGVKKLGEDAERRFEPQILRETGVIGDNKKQPQTSTTIKQWQP